MYELICKDCPIGCLGRITMEGNGAYAISKHALVAFSNTLRQEMKKWGVKVSIIEPTGFHTGK